MSDAPHLQQLRVALLDLAISASCCARLRRPNEAATPAQARLRAALAGAHAALGGRDPQIAPESPLQVVAAAIDYARDHGVAWTDIVALVSRETVAAPEARIRKDIDA